MKRPRTRENPYSAGEEASDAGLPAIEIQVIPEVFNEEQSSKTYERKN